MKRLGLGLLFSILLSASAFGQAVQQSGSVTPGRVAIWNSPGVIKDGGSTNNPAVTSFGVMNNGGPAICINSAPQTAAARNQLCLAITTNGGAKISSYIYGTATTPGIVFDINGTVQGFPTVNSLPVVANNAVCFDGTLGQLKDCGFAPIPGSLPTNQIFVGSASNLATAVSMSGDCTIVAAGTITCTSSGGVAFGALAFLNEIANAQVASGAAIAYSKLALTNSIVNADINSAAAIAYSKLALTNSIVNADINSAAAIAYSKLALTNSIVNADINSAAAIAYSKLNLALSIVNGDISASAGIDLSKLASQAGGTVVGNATGASAVPTATATPILGVPGTTIGTLRMAGNTSGTVTITPQATAGSPTLTLPNASGTFAISATSPIVLSATTGALTCPTCATSSGGGAITGTAPVAVSGAGVVSITGLSGGVLAGSGPAFTRTPVLGVAGTAVGSLGFQNATSGTVTLQPVTGALGTVTINIPAAAGTIAVSATAPITLSAAGAIGVTAAALTRVDDTNVTLTLGGTPASSLLAATSLTLGWTGQLSVARGGTGIASGTSGGIPYYSGTTTIASSGVLSANQVVMGGGAGTTPTSITPSAVLDIIGSTRGQVLYRGASGWAALAVGSSGQVLSTNGVGADPSWISAGGTGTVTTITAGTGITLSSGATCTTTCTINVDKATSANLEAGASNKVLTADIIYDAEVSLSFSTTPTWDFSTFLNARLTLTNNISALTCSNIKASQSGTISLVQDGTGGRTMVAGWCSQFRWANGSRGVLSTALNAIDALFYTCVSTSICYVSLGKAQAN